MRYEALKWRDSSRGDRGCQALACCDKGLQLAFDKIADIMSAGIALVLALMATSAQLDLDCAKPESARALIDYAQLSEIEQVEDIHRDELDKALAGCASGAKRETCRTERRRQADLDWERKLSEIKARYQKMHKDFEERCRASIARGNEARAVS
ncbi:MAG TPA: hypothetical protein VEL48_08085 [Candidatus Acidoferrales bacterium]|nr:hypothetical protein [Candidatus Acidoferrales bacterium]